MDDNFTGPVNYKAHQGNGIMHTSLDVKGTFDIERAQALVRSYCDDEGIGNVADVVKKAQSYWHANTETYNVASFEFSEDQGCHTQKYRLYDPRITNPDIEIAILSQKCDEAPDISEAEHFVRTGTVPGMNWER